MGFGYGYGFSRIILFTACLVWWPVESSTTCISFISKWPTSSLFSDKTVLMITCREFPHWLVPFRIEPIFRFWANFSLHGAKLLKPGSWFCDPKLEPVVLMQMVFECDPVLEHLWGGRKKIIRIIKKGHTMTIKDHMKRAVRPAAGKRVKEIKSISFPFHRYFNRKPVYLTISSFAIHYFINF